MSDPSPQPGAPLHGPGGLLATPGLGTRTRRKGRKWGVATKATKIVGNLYRANDGKFSAGGDTPAGATPKRGIVLSKQPKPAARPKPTRAAAPKKGRTAKKPAGAKPKDPAIAARQQQRDQEHTADRAQRQADRQARLARQAQRDQEHAQDRAERAKKQQDAAGKRAADKIGKGLEKLTPKPAKAGGGGGSKKPSDDDKRHKKSQTALDTAGSVGISPADLGALRDSAEGLGGHGNATLTKLGLIGSDGEATDQGRRALSALERGDVRQYRAALQDAQARMGRESASAQRKQQAEGRRAQSAGDRARRQQQKLERLKKTAQRGGKLTDTQRNQLTDAGLAEETGSMWRLKVYKDHRGQSRWITRTTTAYRDRDGEIISSDALDQDSQRMMATKQFGPLRYWHVGQPDPFDVSQPWGPGIDIGDCDYSCLIGRTRIESGTFRDARVAQKVARQSEHYELSPGFFHPLDQPGPDGVFSAIRTFERSIVPTKHGRASNLFTGLAVKEHRMDIQEMEKRFKAAIVDLGLDAAQAEALGAQLVATEKAATAQGVAFKSDASAPQDEITINGVVYTVKAAPPELEAAGDPVVETKAPGDMPMDDGDGMDDEAGEVGDYVGDMTVADFETMIANLLAPVLKLQDMVKSVGDAHAELKTMYGGVASKDDSRAQELIALKTQYQDLAGKIAEIEGNQPATVLPADVAEALKSAGPATPAEPEKKQIVATPERPWAGWGAQTFPELYQTNE